MLSKKQIKDTIARIKDMPAVVPVVLAKEVAEHLDLPRICRAGEVQEAAKPKKVEKVEEPQDEMVMEVPTKQDITNL